MRAELHVGTLFLKRFGDHHQWRNWRVAEEMLLIAAILAHRYNSGLFQSVEMTVDAFDLIRIIEFD